MAAFIGPQQDSLEFRSNASIATHPEQKEESVWTQKASAWHIIYCAELQVKEAFDLSHWQTSAWLAVQLPLHLNLSPKLSDQLQARSLKAFSRQNNGLEKFGRSQWSSLGAVLFLVYAPTPSHIQREGGCLIKACPLTTENKINTQYVHLFSPADFPLWQERLCVRADVVGGFGWSANSLNELSDTVVWDPETLKRLYQITQAGFPNIANKIWKPWGGTGNGSRPPECKNMKTHDNIWYYQGLMLKKGN